MYAEPHASPAPAPIPAKVIDRYRKFRAIAQDSASVDNERKIATARMMQLGEKYPQIDEVLARIEGKEQEAAARKGQTWQAPRPTREEIEELIPQALRKVGKMLGLSFVDLGVSALDWAADQIDHALADAAHHNYQLGRDIDPMEGFMLQQRIQTEVEIEIEDVEMDVLDGNDRVSVEDGVEIKLVMPVELLQRIHADPRGAVALLDYVALVYHDGEGDEEEG